MSGLTRARVKAKGQDKGQETEVQTEGRTSVVFENDSQSTSPRDDFDCRSFATCELSTDKQNATVGCKRAFVEEEETATTSNKAQRLNPEESNSEARLNGPVGTFELES